MAIELVPLPVKVPKSAGDDSAALLRFLELLLLANRELQEQVKSLEARVTAGGL